MAEVTLILKADNSEYIRKMKEAETATQKVYDSSKKGDKEQLGRIEEIRQSIDRLTVARDKSTDITKIEAYNKRLKEEKDDLKELENAGVKATNNVAKSTDKMSEAFASSAKKLTLVGTAIALIVKVGRDMINTFKDTTIAINTMTYAGEIWKQLIYNLIKLETNWQASMALSMTAAKMANDLRKQERIDLVEIAKLRKEYNQLYFESADRGKDDAERLKLMDEAMAVHTKMVDTEIKNAKEELAVIALQLSGRKDQNKLLDEEAKLKAKIIDLEGTKFSETKRLKAQQTALEEQMHNETMQRYFDEIEANNKLQDEKLKKIEQFKNLSIQLIDEYDKAEIESLEGEAKLEAQKNYELKAIAQFKAEMEKLGKLSKEQNDMFVALGMSVWESFYKGLKEAEEDAAKDYKEIGDAYLKEWVDRQEADKKMGDAYLEDWIKREDERIKKNQELVDSTKRAADEIIDAISSIYDARVEDAQRTREIYDTQISELEHEVDREVELQKAGYASNVQAKQKELDQLKAARDRALRAEEEALQKQRTMEAISQTISLATSAAELIKAGIKEGGLYGLILAGVEIAAMFLMWDSYKQQAKSSTKLAKGGSGADTGMVTGKSHASGGERFTDQIEVERGEAWGVLSVPATQKYGKIFHEMVSSFNKGEIPVIEAPKVNNNVLVNNNGSNSRLDQLINENRKLNEKLSGESIQDNGAMRVIRKNDNIRIVRR